MSDQAAPNPGVDVDALEVEAQPDGDSHVRVTRKAWDNVTAAARRKDARRAELVRLRRENVLLRAGLGGVEEDSPLGQALWGAPELTVEGAREIALQLIGPPSVADPEPADLGAYDQAARVEDVEDPALAPGEEDQTVERSQLASPRDY